MNLFAFPVEIRLKIYSELLVHHRPLSFFLPFGDDLPSRLCPERVDLCPTLLRASKQVHGEAISLLYSDNCFRFSDPDVASTRWPTAIVSFVRQIGAQASLLRHVCIDFPTIRPTEDEHESRLREENIDTLGLLRETCPGITTLELVLHSDRDDSVLCDSSVFTDLLDLLHRRLESFRFLQEVRIEVQLLDWDTDEQSDDVTEDSEDEGQEGPFDGPWRPRTDSLKELCSRGWAVNIIKIPPVKKTWICPDDIYEFDNEDDYDDYMSVWYRREQEREDEAWEEYHRQREEYDRQRRIESYNWYYADDGGPA